MTDRPPVNFENYPLDPDVAASDPVPSEGKRSPAPAGWQPTPPPAPAPPAGPSRRRVLTGVAGGVALLGLAGMMASQGASGPTFPDGMTSMTAEPETSVNLSGYEVPIVDGWTLEEYDEATTAVLTRGANAVVFRYFTASSDATAAEEAERLLKRHSGDLTKRGETKVSSSGDDELAKGTARSTGRVGGKPAVAEARVRIEVDDEEALAVIAIVLDNASDAVRKAVTTMRDTFLEQLG